MKLLLDTHAALWFLSADDRLGDIAKRLMFDDGNRVLLSSAVVLEVSVKRSLGKLDVPDDYLERLLGSGAQPLPITIDHVAAVERLPWHHRDLSTASSWHKRKSSRACRLARQGAGRLRRPGHLVSLV